MNIAQVNASNFSNQDTQAAIYYIEQENLRRAALTSPGTPLPLATAQERKNSYEIVLTDILTAAHLGHLTIAAENNATARQIREALKGSPTQAQLNAALAGLTS